MQHILDHWSGGDGEFVYCIYSGLITFLCVVTSVLVFYWHHTCHLGRCPRWARHDYAMDATSYRLCSKHHPTARAKLRHRHIVDHYAANSP